MKSILEITDDALDQIMATAYSSYQAGRYEETAVLCRGLIATDHTYWWSHSLYAATLRRLGRLDEALAETDEGLHHEPREPKLLALRAELVEAIGARDATVTSVPSTLNPPAALAAASR
jgi:hypothetical protein